MDDRDRIQDQINELITALRAVEWEARSLIIWTVEKDGPGYFDLRRDGRALFDALRRLDELRS